MRESSNVLMLGPGLNVRGGVSGVERMLLNALPENVHATHIATMVEGGKWTKAVTFAHSLAKLTLALGHHPDVVHIHFASGASNIRKIILARIALARGASVIMHAHGGGYQKHWASMSPSGQVDHVEHVAKSAAAGGARRGMEDFLRVHRRAQAPHRRHAESSGAAGQSAGASARRQSPLCLFRADLPAARVSSIWSKPSHSYPRSVARESSSSSRATARWSSCASRPTSSAYKTWSRFASGSITAERDRLLAGAHAFVLPSHTEGLADVVARGDGLGLAPICTPVGSIPEYVVNDANGLLIAPGDVSQLAAAIEKLVSQEANRVQMGRACPRHGGTVVRQTVFESHVRRVPLRCQRARAGALTRMSFGSGMQALVKNSSCSRSATPPCVAIRCSMPMRSASWNVWSAPSLNERRQWTRDRLSKLLFRQAAAATDSSCAAVATSRAGRC